MASTLLQFVQQFCLRTGLPSPASAIASPDDKIRQIVGLLNEVIEELVDRWTWQALTREATFTTVAGEDQGLIATFAPDGFHSIINETIWNRTTRLPVFGPLNSVEWQAQIANPATGPWNQYRIRTGHLIFNPVGTAGQSCFFEYRSNFGIVGAGSILSDRFLADADTTLFDDKLILAGLRWKWKSEKGLEYGEDMARFESMAKNGASRDGTARVLTMNAGDCVGPKPGIWVPPGNWPMGH